MNMHIGISDKGNLKRMVFMICATFICGYTYGQEWKRLDTEKLFQKARQEAFEGNRDMARNMLTHLLSLNPNYTDARILLGRTHAWDGNREVAKEIFREVIEKHPENSVQSMP